MTPEQRSKARARREAREIARGQRHLPKQITSGHKAAVKRLDSRERGRKYRTDLTPEERHENWDAEDKWFWLGYKEAA